MTDQKPLFKSPYDIKDVGALFTIVTFILIIAAIFGNNLFMAEATVSPPIPESNTPIGFEEFN